MLNIVSKLKGKTTPADLRAVLADVEAALAEAERRHADLLAKREAVFLDGSAAEIERLQDELSKAGRDVDRLGVQVTGLARRLAEAQQAEARAAIEAKIAEGEAASDEGVRLLRESYVRQAKAMAGTLRRLAEIEALIGKANAAITEAAEAGKIDERARIALPHERAATPSSQLGAPPSPTARTFLPSLSGWGAPMDNTVHHWGG